MIYRRGEVREIILREHREGLRFLPNPDTRLPFTEDEIRRATSRGGRFYREADGIDLVGLGHQKRDEFFAQQVRIDRAGSGYLRTYHAVLWGETYLPAFGGSGIVAGRGNPGTIWAGSTTVPDPFAVFGTDPAGRRYQVVINAEADAAGNAELVLIAIDGGDETNIASGTLIKWANPPPGSAPDAAAIIDFGGGLDAETDADFARRLSDRVRHKPASGNWSHFRTFARQASVSVEDAFVYPCAFHAGSVLVAVTQKRGATPGPLARVAGFNVLSAVTSMLVPPGSPVIPGRAHVVVVTVQPEPTDFVVRLAQPLGSGAGWTDLVPFPQVDGTDAVAITAITDQTHFEITTGSAGQLPQGAAGPLGGVHLMVWDAATSLFVPLPVKLVTDLGAGVYAVELTGPTSSKTLVMGDWISPDMSRRAELTVGVNAYFDSLGPGEVIDLATDERSVRCFRNPVTSEAFPSRAGQSVLTFLGEALGAPVSDSTLASITLSTPSLPADPVDGPKLLVAGNFGVYALS